MGRCVAQRLLLEGEILPVPEYVNLVRVAWFQRQRYLAWILGWAKGAALVARETARWLQTA